MDANGTTGTEKTMDQKIKFLWNGIKVDGKLYRAHYSLGHLYHYPEDTITVYARDLLVGLPRLDGIEVENHTDLQTDYFESDTCRILAGSKYHAEALAAYEAQEVHAAKRKAKFEARCAAYQASRA
jgi:hypothetical protein